MANLKSGTLIGGNLIWDAGSLPLSVSGGNIFINGKEVYTEFHKPTPAEVGAVNKTGDTMTGDLVVQSRTGIVSKGVGSNNVHYWLRRPNDTHAGLIYWESTTQNIRISKYNVTGSSVDSEIALGVNTINASKPILVDAAQSSDANALTRKDYVNSEDAKKLNLTGGTVTGVIKSTSANIIINTQNERVLHSDTDIVLGNTVKKTRIDGGSGILAVASDKVTSNKDLYVNTSKVYHQGFKPTASDVGALTKEQGDGYYLGKTAKAVSADISDKVAVNNSTSDANYPVVWHGGSNSLYNTLGGLMFQASTGKLTSTLLYEGVNRVYSAANKPSAADVGAVSTANAYKMNPKTLGDTNYDSITTEGFYLVPGSSQGSINAPYVDDSLLQVWSYGGYTYQNAVSYYNEGIRHFRCFKTDVANITWEKVYTSANKPSAADVGALSTVGKAVDSDKLDGLDSSSFLRSDDNDSFSGDLVSTSRDKGVFGTYDQVKTDQIWSIGTAYRNDANGSNFGTLYGLAYKHTNNKTGGDMAGGHQMVWCTSGIPRSALGESGIWTAGVVTSNITNSVKLNATGTTVGLGITFCDKSVVGGVNDAWLRLNPFSQFTDGIYCGAVGALRHDGNIQTPTLYLGSNTSVAKLTTASTNQDLKITTKHGYLNIGPQNTAHCHYDTDRPSHLFTKEVRVKGEIYCGASYSQRVYHQGWKPTTADVTGSIDFGTF